MLFINNISYFQDGTPCYNNITGWQVSAYNITNYNFSYNFKFEFLKNVCYQGKCVSTGSVIQTPCTDEITCGMGGKCIPETVEFSLTTKSSRKTCHKKKKY